MDLLTTRAGLVCALLCLSLSPTVRAQILSPGKLGQSHAAIEGLQNCTQCHDLGKKVQGDKCLLCHKALAGSIKKGRGLHAQAATTRKQCCECHRDHRDRQGALAEWGGPRLRFDHARAGFELTGRHSEIACESCHNKNFVDDSALKKRLQKKTLATFLGVARRCDRCHFDQHRAQLGSNCQRCHDQRQFKNTPGFRHDKIFELAGQHARITCQQCHPAQASGPAKSSRLVSGDQAGYRLFKGRPRNCAGCHSDVHLGKFGARCERCHDPQSWKTTSTLRRDRRFHQKTRYPLAGKHATAACESCHPARRGGKLKTRGLAFAHCDDCHLDAHFAQMPKTKDGHTPCDRCHTVDGFFPPRYPLADHQKTRFALEGSHLAVACSRCHPVDPERFAQKVPPALRGAGKKIARNKLLNFTRIRMPQTAKLGSCDTCHRDPHGGQFGSDGPIKPCAQCHQLSSFFDLTFDHAKDSRYPLVGKHQKLDCRACHRPSGDDGQGLVRYRGVDTRCASCHVDPHGGQFGDGGCARCHDVKGFKPSRFDHDDPKRSRFALTGAHKLVACRRCHPALLAEGETEPPKELYSSSQKQAPPERQKTRAARWYRGLPIDCQGCHARRHEAPTPIDCVRCHDDVAWAQVRFDHDETDFALRQRHAELACDACHLDDKKLALDARCQSCHQDVHAGRLGGSCARCHEASSFKNGMGVLAHGESRLPLVGRHALIACASCHKDSVDRSFVGPAASCKSCHWASAQATAGGSVDHTVAGTPSDCQKCHVAVRWRQAQLPEHDRCYPISTGAHRFIACDGCHTGPAGLVVDQCQSFSADCRRCHGCAEMDREHREENVAGYACEFRKCYECHPGGAE